LSSLARVMRELLKTEHTFMALYREAQAPLIELHSTTNYPASSWIKLLSHFVRESGKQQWLFHKQEGPLQDLAMPLYNLLVKRITIRPDIVFILGAANKLTGAFQAPDLKLFNTIAEAAGANLENAIFHQEMLVQTRIQTEMDLARQVQIRLLPQCTPTVPGLQLAAKSRPASHVGGDFFDFVSNDDRLLSLTVGDVSGKGMPAALLMAMVRTVLRGMAQKMDVAAPARLLDHANENLYEDFTEVDMFATIFVGQYDVQQHILRYANDGHAPVIYRPAQGTATLLAADAPPLGLLPTNLAAEHTLDFQADDLLVIASDGFGEAENSTGEMFGIERLLQLIDELAASPAQEIIRQLFERIDQFTGDYAQSDDQTVLIMKRTQVDERST
jgi:phosphoserine phosphatase RsbU/P